MSSKNPQHNGAPALEHGRGRITCGSRERRRLYEQLGLEGEVEFIGDALDAGRQAVEGDYEDEESDDESGVEGPRSETDEEVRAIVERAQEDDSDE